MISPYLPARFNKRLALWLVWGGAVGLLAVGIFFIRPQAEASTDYEWGDSWNREERSIGNVAPVNTGAWKQGSDAALFASTTDCDAIKKIQNARNAGGTDAAVYALWAARPDRSVNYKVNKEKRIETYIDHNGDQATREVEVETCNAAGNPYNKPDLVDNLTDASIAQQTPFLIVGFDSTREGDNTGFHNPEVEIDLWIPIDVDIKTLNLETYRFCGRDDTDHAINNINQQYTKLYLTGKNYDLDNPEVLLRNSSECTSQTETINLSSAITEMNKPDPLDTKELLAPNSSPARFKEYKLFKLRAQFGGNEGSSYYNQFKIRVKNKPDSYLAFPRLTNDLEFEGNELETGKVEGALGISNRMADNHGPNDTNANLMALWEMTFIIAPPGHKGCSEKYNNWIGLYDHDYIATGDESWVGWQKYNNAYPPTVTIDTIDRNQYLYGTTNAWRDNVSTFKFNGVLNNVWPTTSGSNRKPTPPEGNGGSAGHYEPKLYASNDVAVGGEVHANLWEGFMQQFSADKIYRVKFSNLNSPSWVQIRLPFPQINALQTCAHKPLFKVNHSDIAVGGVFGTQNDLNACPADALDSVQGNLYAHSNPVTKIGSSTRYGARVHDRVYGFYSNYKSTNDAPSTFKERTFANNDDTAAYGGNFNYGRCLPNYWRGTEGLTATPLPAQNLLDINTLKDNDAKLYQPPNNAKLTLINNQTAALHLKATIYVDGDLYIRNNLINTQNSTSWREFNKIDYIYLIVKGNIYIQPDVTRLDAVLIAYTDDSQDQAQGHLYTCYFDEAVQATSSGTIYQQECDDKLTVNGALIGQTIHLGRSFSRTDTTQVGEEINLLPEYFVGTPQLPGFEEWLYGSDSLIVLPVNF